MIINYLKIKQIYEFYFKKFYLFMIKDYLIDQ